MDGPVYLRADVQAEPLVNRWYAWLHLLSPATAALNLERRYLKIMRSYVKSAKLHATMLENPAMRGGPFIDLGGQHADGVRALVEDTERDNRELLGLAGALGELHRLLRDKAVGASLESLYPEVPDALRGYVELAYDGEHRPCFRLLEALLYRSAYYMPHTQSIALSVTSEDVTRPFVMSTPRLPSDAVVDIHVPFSHRGLDRLFRSRSEPWPLAELAAALDVPSTDQARFGSLFSSEPPPPKTARCEAARIRYYGHACLSVETREVSLLLDPCVSYSYPSSRPSYTHLDLPAEIDLVLITHTHQDHLHLETLLQLRHKLGTVVVGRNLDGMLEDPSPRLMLNACGFDHVRELDNLESIAIPGGKVTGIPFLGEHHDLRIGSKLGYLIELDGRSMLVLADSCNHEPRLYERLHAITGDIDMLFIGMECDGAPLSWAYGPLLAGPIDREADRSRRGRGSNCGEALDIVHRFNFSRVYVYAMGLEPWLGHILDIGYTDDSYAMREVRSFIEACQGLGIRAELLRDQHEIELADVAVRSPR
jgi:L-ascorbate metabolism protein UlaG (beta-lactamase superfamily)